MRIVALCSILLPLSGCYEKATPTTPAVSQATIVENENAAITVEIEDQQSEDSQSETPFVIDVRTQEEWDSGHVEQAVHIPVGEIADRIEEVTSDKSAKIVLYCKSGGRAGRAKETLEGLGFTNVDNAGGYEDLKDRFLEPPQ